LRPSCRDRRRLLSKTSKNQLKSALSETLHAEGTATALSGLKNDWILKATDCDQILETLMKMAFQLKCKTFIEKQLP
jgi:hypothetical protein